MLLLIYSTCPTLYLLKSLRGLSPCSQFHPFKIILVFPCWDKVHPIHFQNTKTYFSFLFSLFFFPCQSLLHSNTFFVIYCLAYQVSLLSLKFKRKVNAILLNLLSENSKAHEKASGIAWVPFLPLQCAHGHSAGRASWQEMVCAQPRQDHNSLYSGSQGCL